MKKIFFSLALVSLMATFNSCKNQPESDKATVEPAKETAAPTQAATTGTAYKLNTATSKATWIGSKPVGKHNGTFDFKSGSIQTDGTNITGGDIIIDVASLKALDQDEKGNTKLAAHLTSPDFLDAAKYPTAIFVITSVAPYTAPANPAEKTVLQGATHNITGNLTIGAKTNSVTFPAKITMDATTLKSESLFNIDRSQWGISYGNDKSLGDKFISPTVTLGFNLEASK